MAENGKCQELHRWIQRSVCDHGLFMSLSVRNAPLCQSHKLRIEFVKDENKLQAAGSRYSHTHSPTRLHLKHSRGLEELGSNNTRETKVILLFEKTNDGRASLEPNQQQSHVMETVCLPLMSDSSGTTPSSAAE